MPINDVSQTLPPKSLRILLAEDNPVNQRLATRILEKQGHEVALAANGKEALAAWQAKPFDLILMDIHMPEMDGFQATSAIRRAEAAFRDLGQDGRAEAARIPDSVPRHGHALCAATEPAQNGPVEAARIPDSVPRHGHALCASSLHIPIVALTAHAISGYREQCLAAGMDDYLSKPIRAKDLLDTIAKHAMVYT